MFTPVLGRSGSGKTAWMLEKAGELGKVGEKVIFLVPEQFSFETERAVYRAYGAKTALNIEVLSFTRLCNKVFYRYGGVAGEYISDTARRLLMSLAVNELKDKLELCAAYGKNLAYGESLLELVEEFKRAGVTPEQVLETARSLQPEAFASKMTELGEIYGVYQAMLERSYLDSADDEARCAGMLEGRDFFSGYTVLVDSFMTYMAGEYRILRQIFASAKDVYISFACPSLSEREEEELGPFSIPVQTVNRLIRDAKAVGHRVSKPVELGENRRFARPELAFLEKNYPLHRAGRFTEKNEAVRLVRASDPYDEILYVAASIARLVREEGCRYRDIAVIGRSLERYQGAVQDIFARYEIPVFLDAREDVTAIPVVSGVVSALEAVCRGFDTASLLSLAKSTLLGFTPEEIGQLENYCYIWGVKGAGFASPFTANPQGLSTEFTPEDKLLLEQLNRTREGLMTPLLALRAGVRGATGRQFAQAVYRFLEDIQAREHLSAYLEREEGAARQYIQRNGAGWSLVMDTLSVFAQVLGDHCLPHEQYIELFRSALYSRDIGSVPHTQDQVMVGMADRIRPNSPKAVFVIGANEGLFPAPAVQGGVFSDAERQELIARGIELSPPAQERSLYEAYYAYFALTAASHWLTVSWHSGLIQGEAQKPSEMFRRLAAMMGESVISTAHLPWEYYVGGGLSLLDEACRRLREDTSVSAALAEAARHSKGGRQMERVLSSLEQGSLVLKDKDKAAALFGERMRLSPSRIEDYHKCPFQFFCYSGLRLRPRRRVEFSPLESGNVIHYVLEKMLGERSAEEFTALSEREIRIRTGELLREYLQSHLTDGEDVTARLQYLFVRLENSVTRLLLHLARELSQSRFVPCGFELDLSQSSDVSPLVLQCEDGMEVEITGKIDRVDKMENDGDRYLRIVDYKSGAKQFRLGDVYHGLNLQMLVYLFTLWKNGKNQFADCLPAGILYMPSGDKMLTASRETGEDELEKARDKHYKMSGLLLEDLIVVRGMEASGLGVYIPASVKKDGSLSVSSSVVNLAQMGLLSRYIQHLIVQMAASLRRGEIAPLPVSGQGYDPCAYCEYAAVCGREKGEPVRELTSLDKEELFALLKEEEGEKP